MNIVKMNFGTRTTLGTLSLIASVLLVGCSSSGSEENEEPVSPQTTDTETTGGDAGEENTDESTNNETTDDSTATVNAAFDGTWRSDCAELRFDNIPEDSQPGTFIQRTLTIDSATNAYSTTRNNYTDSQCMLEDPEETVFVFTGEIKFDGIVTTSSGMDATVARYFSDDDTPDVVGLLYRDGDILYREAAQSGVIDDSVPTELNLSMPWRLVN